MNGTDFSLKENPWKIFDLMASYWGASQNVEQPLVWVERPMGGKEYRLRFALSKSASSVSFEDVITQCPEIEAWLDAQGWNVRTVHDNIQDLVRKEVSESTWDAERLPDQKIVRCRPRRPPPLQWNYYDELRKIYWSSLLKTEGFGRSADQWARQMKQHLTQEKTPAALTWVNNQLRRLLERQPNWEVQSGQSFRAWSRNNKSWERVLDRMSVSYRVTQDAVPLVLWAIENDWSYGCKKWCEESNLSLNFVPLSQNVPTTWWNSDEELPTGSLWHWACRVGSRDMIKDMLVFDGSLLASKDTLGRTALHWACAAGREDIIDLLVSKGASLTTESTEGKIPAEMVPDAFDRLFEKLEDLRTAKKNIGESAFLTK